MSSFCDMPEFYSETFPEARKPHDCVECNAPIAPGEKHLYFRGKWDGQFDRGRQHMLCRELCMLMNDDGDECCPFGGMKETFREQDFELQSYKLDPLPKQARALMAQIIRRERAAGGTR